jgi:hypothetical protein
MPWVVKRLRAEAPGMEPEVGPSDAAIEQLRRDLDRVTAELRFAVDRFGAALGPRTARDQETSPGAMTPPVAPRIGRASMRESPLADLFRATDNRPRAR